MDPRRSQRLAESLREELSELIALEMADPRTHGIHVTDVHLSPDGKVASVMLFIPGDEEHQKQVLLAMDRAKAFLKNQLKPRINVFRMPELRFEADMRVDRTQRLEYLLKKMRKGRPRDAKPAEQVPPPPTSSRESVE